MAIWWLMAVPVGFVALMLFFAWASDTGRLPRWSRAMNRWSERHPILVLSTPSVIWLTGAAYFYATGNVLLAALWTLQAILWVVWGVWVRRQ